VEDEAQGVAASSRLGVKEEDRQGKGRKSRLLISDVRMAGQLICAVSRGAYVQAGEYG